VQVGEDAVTGSDDARTLAIDERSERLAVTREDSVHDRPFVKRDGGLGCLGRDDRSASAVDTTGAGRRIVVAPSGMHGTRATGLGREGRTVRSAVTAVTATVVAAAIVAAMTGLVAA